MLKTKKKRAWHLVIFFWDNPLFDHLWLAKMSSFLNSIDESLHWTLLMWIYFLSIFLKWFMIKHYFSWHEFELTSEKSRVWNQILQAFIIIISWKPKSFLSNKIHFTVILFQNLSIFKKVYYSLYQIQPTK